MADIKQYLPQFYEVLYGKTNTVTLSAELWGQILKDISSYPMNNWDDLEVLNREFKTEDVIVPGFRVRETSFLKSFFKFKGTNSDLQYVLNNLGYESVIYNDGGMLHSTDKTDEHGNPEYEIVDVTGYGKSTPCAIEIQVQIDLNNPNYSGFTSQGFGGLKQVVEERVSMCSFLDKISVSVTVTEDYPMNEMGDDLIIRYHIIGEDEYFEEVTLPPIIYGREQNDDLKYTNPRKNTQRAFYGQDKLKLFRPLEDEMVYRENRGFDDQVINPNTDDDKNGVPMSDHVKELRYNGSLDEYSLLDFSSDSIEIRRRTFRELEDPYDFSNFGEEVHIVKTTYHDYRTRYGKKQNDNLTYLKKALTKFGDLFNPPEDTGPTVTETWWRS